MHNLFTPNPLNVSSIDSFIIDEDSEEINNSTANISLNNFEKSYFDIFHNNSNELNIINNNSVKKVENKNKKKLLFVAQNRKRKRGKQGKGKSQKERSAWDRDNIITKIQVHFLNFVIHLLTN